MADTEPGVVLGSCEYMEDQTNLKLFSLFCLKNISFGFCSCYELLHWIFVEKTLYGYANCSAPKAGMGVAKGDKLKVFYLSTILWKVFKVKHGVLWVVEG